VLAPLEPQKMQDRNQGWRDALVAGAMAAACILGLLGLVSVAIHQGWITWGGTIG
jgi:hypothetical protein